MQASRTHPKVACGNAKYIKLFTLRPRPVTEERSSFIWAVKVDTAETRRDGLSKHSFTGHGMCCKAKQHAQPDQG
jgi:hypothetical protein